MEKFTALLVSLSAVLVALLLSSYWRMLNYWEKRRIPQERPIPFFGNFWDVIALKKQSSKWLKDIYDKLDAPYFGVHILQNPFLVVKDPELVKQVLIRDFDVFSDRTVADSKYDKIVKNALFFQKNLVWKMMRMRLSTTFSTGKLRAMVESFNSVGRELASFITDGEIEVRHLTSRYATEVSLKNFFGVTGHSFAEEKPLFLGHVQNMLGASLRNAFSQMCFFFVHSLVNPLKLKFLSEYSSDFFVEIFQDVLRQRRGTGVKHNDLTDTILDILEDKEFCKKTKFDDDVAIAPAINLLLGGNDTSTTTISFTLYELALHGDVKRKLVKDIVSSIKKHKGVTYDAIQDMKYLRMCINETLRKYPVVPFLTRECNRTYTLPGTDVVLEKGEGVLVSVMGLHYDPKYFPEPDKYIPERYEEKMNDGGLYYIPFGEGPRICIGARFGLLSVQVALIHILTKFDVKICPKTPIPMEFDPKTVLLTSKSELVLKFESLKDPLVL